MSVRRNITANFASQVYVTLASIVFLPLYVSYIGVEAYGLVGFFVTLTTLFQVLDLGLAATMTREIARYRGGAKTAGEVRGIFRVFELCFFAIACAGCIAVLLLSNALATRWLQVERLAIGEVETSIALMGVAIGLRFMAGFYRSVAVGFEHQVWLAGFNSVVATLRFGFILPVLAWVGSTPTIFFGYQLVIALVEVFALLIYAYRTMPRPVGAGSLDKSWANLRGSVRFTAGVSVLSLLHLAITQADKLALSRLVPLTEYSLFSLTTVVAGGIITMTAPVTQAVLPRMAKIAAEGKPEDLIRLYRETTQLVCVLVIPMAVCLGLFAAPILVAWTGNETIGRNAGPLLALYSIGNALLAVSAFAYYLQYAHGSLRLHVIGQAGFALVWVPALVIGASFHGAVGAAVVWVVMTAIFFLAWLPVVHARFAPGLHLRWLAVDVLPILAFGAAAGLLLQFFIVVDLPRWMLALELFTILAIIGFSSALGSSKVRALIRSYL